MQGGDALRSIRERLGLTLRDVEAAGSRLVEKYSNPEYALPISRLSDIETKGVLPTLFRLYSFAAIYRLDVRELMAIFGIELGNLVADSGLVNVPRTHKATNSIPAEARVPVKMDPAFDLRRTSNVGRMICEWGTLPLTILQQFESDGYSYGYIGTEDFTMYPLLMPGAFIRVDETRHLIKEGPWRSEYERPIYFLETREGYVCSWCEMVDNRLLLRPHPLSPETSRMLQDDEVDIIGQVVAVAMPLDQQHRTKKPR